MGKDVLAGGWRERLTRTDPSVAGLPASLNAVQLLVARGQRDAAVEACKALLTREPRNVQALRQIVILLRQSARNDECVAFLDRLHRLELEAMELAEEDRHEALEFLRHAELATTPEAAPPAFVRATFDRYAGRFDEHLTRNLCYQGPEQIVALLSRLLDPGVRRPVVLDVGCGTGLAGAAVRRIAGRLDGVDLSAAMLEQARLRGIYDRLETGEVVEWLRRQPRSYDLIVAADVFAYLGDLGPVLDGCRHALDRDGLLLFTVESAGSGNYHLGRTRRFAHSHDYVVDAAARAGLSLVATEPAVLRTESGKPVESRTNAFRPAAEGAGLPGASKGR
jgi:predicted TPR repeat methyltransferase